MGRNDLCFCMSGKKTKKCHPDIHEESIAAAKLKVYGELNEKLKGHRQNAKEDSLCIEGCSDCCFDYYTIQSIEFDMILNELSKWDEDRLNDLIKRVDKYWNMFEEEYPEVKKLLSSNNKKELEEINSSIDKTSFPCVFLDEITYLCQIYEVRPFKCRIFGNTYYNTDEGAMAIACQKYESLLNDDTFYELLCDATEIIDKNTDLSILHDKKRNIAVLDSPYPLIYHLYKHFTVDGLGVKINNYDEKFTMTRYVFQK